MPAQEPAIIGRERAVRREQGEGGVNASQRKGVASRRKPAVAVRQACAGRMLCCIPTLLPSNSSYQPRAKLTSSAKDDTNCTPTRRAIPRIVLSSKVSRRSIGEGKRATNGRKEGNRTARTRKDAQGATIVLLDRVLHGAH